MIPSLTSGLEIHSVVVSVVELYPLSNYSHLEVLHVHSRLSHTTPSPTLSSNSSLRPRSMFLGPSNIIMFPRTLPYNNLPKLVGLLLRHTNWQPLLERSTTRLIWDLPFSPSPKYPGVLTHNFYFYQTFYTSDTGRIKILTEDTVFSPRKTKVYWVEFPWVGLSSYGTGCIDISGPQKDQNSVDQGPEATTVVPRETGSREERGKETPNRSKWGKRAFTKGTQPLHRQS